MKKLEIFEKLFSDRAYASKTNWLAIHLAKESNLDGNWYCDRITARYINCSRLMALYFLAANNGVSTGELIVSIVKAHEKTSR